MDDDQFHYMMQAQDRKFYQTFSDQVLLFNDLCDSQVYEKCDLSLFSSESTKDLGKERIQSTSKLPVWNEDNSKFLDSDLEEPEGDDQSTVADIVMNSPRMAYVEDCAHKPMEDIHEPDMPQVLLRSSSMMQFNEATNSDVEDHATLEAKVVCDSSRFTANSVKMPDDQRMDRLVAEVKALPDVQEDQLAESLDVPSQCSAVSACVGSSSGDLVLDKMENIKSELIPNNFIKIILKM